MRKLICLLLCLLLCGCGREEPVPTEPTEPPVPPTQPVVEVPLETETTMRLYEGITLSYDTLLDEDDPEAAVLRQAAGDFYQTTGAMIQINYATDAAWEGIAGGDIFEISGGAFQGKLLTGALDLTELAEVADYDSKSWEVLRNQIISRYGILKGIAIRPYLYGMYYNRGSIDALGVDAMPNTWQEYLEFCQMLKDSGYEGLVIDQERANLVLELHMERALGWETLKETMVYAQWRTNEMAMTMIREAIAFAEKGYLVKGNPAAYPQGQNRLAQSNALFVAGSNLLCSEVERSTMSEIQWGVCPYPGDGPGTGLLVDADVVAIREECAYPEVAFEFILMLTTGEYDQLRADVALGIPTDPANTSPITGVSNCMASAAAYAPKWFTQENNELFTRLWNGYYKTGSYFADQLNKLSRNFESEKSVG